MVNYYNRPEVSNSTLTALKKYFMPAGQFIDLQAAYRFGTLVDSFLTEPAAIDYRRRIIGDYVYTGDEFLVAQEMKNIFLLDPFCRHIYDTFATQVVTVVENFPINYSNHAFTLATRMKSDFEPKPEDLVITDMVIDYKSTACTSAKAFEQSIRYFCYDRQAAWYMDHKKVNQFLFIGQSKKKPYTIFKVPIKRGDNYYLSGLAEYQYLAFRHWSLF